MRPTKQIVRLAPRLSGEQARERLTRGRLGRRLDDRRTGKLELVGMPCVLVTAGILVEGRRQKVRCLVDRGVGRAASIEGVVAEAIDAVRGNGDPQAPTSAAPLAPTSAAPLAPAWSVAECEAEAERFLSRRVSILQRAQSWSFTGEAESRQVVYPYWVLYFRRRRGWDLRALDGLTGEGAGAIGKRGLVAALVEAESACEDRGSDKGPRTARSSTSEGEG